MANSGATARKILRRLKKAFPDALCTLDFRNEFELLIATILSAQCTDKRVNEVTSELFRRFQTPKDFVKAGVPAVEKAIKSTGFYRNKAKNIVAACEQIDRGGGRVPNDFDRLVALPGVGRKTANVVLGSGFGIAAGIAVDTHVGRIARRLGLSSESNPEKVERDLAALFPKSEWIGLSHRLIQLGRSCCSARAPRCGECVLNDLCPSQKKAK